MALSLFFLAKAAQALLPTTHFVMLGPTFPIVQVQRVRDFPKGCTILQAHRLSRQHQLVCHISYFFLFVYYTFLFFIFFSFSRTLAHLAGTIHSFLLPYPTTMVLGQPFTSRNGTTDKLAKRSVLLKPFTVPCSRSSLISRHHSSILLDCKRTAKSVFITQIFSVSTKNLCLLITLAASTLVFAATVFCQIHVSLELEEWRIRHATSMVIQLRAFLILFCSVLLRTLYTRVLFGKSFSVHNL